MLREQSFNTGVVDINYVEGPESGPPLVLLHGLGRRWQDFLSVIPALSTRWHIYALDFRGHGRSGRVAGPYRIDDYVRDTFTFLNQRVAEPPVLFGHSLGGGIAAILAASFPKTVRALVVGDTPLYTERLMERMDVDEFIAWRTLAGSERSVDDLTAALMDMVASRLGPDVSGLRGNTQWMDAADLRFMAKCLSQLDPGTLTTFIDGRFPKDEEQDELLKRLSCPVLLLQGNPALGALLTDGDIERGLPLIRRAFHVRFENLGHGLHLVEAGPVVRAVTNFLESL